MSTIPTPTPTLNPHARRMTGLLGLVAALFRAGDLTQGAAALQSAWSTHERWPLDLDEKARCSALRALSDAEKALVRLRSARYAVEAERIVQAEGWAA